MRFFTQCSEYRVQSSENIDEYNKRARFSKTKISAL